MADTFDPMTARLEDAPSTAKKDEFDPSTATLEKPRTWGEAAKDTGAAVMGGLAGLVKTGGDLYGLASGNMDNAASELGRNAQEYWSDAKSQALQTKIAQRKANIDAQESTLGKAWTAVKDTLTDPALAADTVAENVATMLPGAGVGRAVGAAKYARGFQAASEFGPASLAAREAIAKQAGKYATGASIGTGAVQQGADVSGDIYGDLMKKTDAEWDASTDFQSALQRHGGDRQAAKSELANATARAAFLPAAGISVAANAIPGATYLERALVGAPLRTGAKEVGRFGAARGFALGVLGEGGQEFVEEGGGRLGANLAAQQQAMPGHNTWDGVGENAGIGFAGGALLGVGGGVHGAREAMAQKRAQGQAKQNQPAKDDGTQSDVPTGMPPDASGGGAAPVEDAGNAGLSAPLGSGVTPDMLVPANPLLDAMRQRATDPGVIAPPINKDEIFDQSAATPVAGELYQPGDTTNPLTDERITAKPSEAMGINPADGPLSTGAAIAVDTGATAHLQQAAAQGQDAAKGKKYDAPAPAAATVDAETGEIDRAAELQSRLDFVRQQAAVSGWDRQLIAERNNAQAELQALTAANEPARAQDGDAQAGAADRFAPTGIRRSVLSPQNLTAREASVYDAWLAKVDAIEDGTTYTDPATGEMFTARVTPAGIDKRGKQRGKSVMLQDADGVPTFSLASDGEAGKDVGMFGAAVDGLSGPAWQVSAGKSPAPTTTKAAAGSATPPAGEPIPQPQGVTSEPQADQAQQSQPQQPQAGVAQDAGAAPSPAAADQPPGAAGVQAAGLTDGATPQNLGAQAAPAAGQKTQESDKAQSSAAKALIRLAGMKGSRLIADDGRGRKLFEVKVTPEFRNRHFVNGRMPMVDGLELKEKSSVTGNSYDDGYILIDNREQLAARRAATPAPGAQAQTQGAAPDLNDVGARWTRMTRLEREAVLKLAGWRTNAGGLNVIGKRLVMTSWGNMVAGTQDKVARAMDTRAEFGGNQVAAPAQQAQAATENVANDEKDGRAQQPMPAFDAYNDAMDWAKARAKSMGMSFIAYRSTDEFKNGVSQQLESLYKTHKAKWDADTAEAGKAMQAAMSQAGIRPGDTVEWVQSGAFLSQDRMSGVVRLDSNGVPQVHMGSEIAVAKPGGKIGYTKKLRWQDYMKKSGEAGKREQNQPVAPAATAQAATESVAPEALELAAQTPAEAAARQAAQEQADKAEAAAMAPAAQPADNAEQPRHDGRYELPAGSARNAVNDEWSGSIRPDFKPSPRQQLVMDAVAQALDDGAFYNRDVDERVARALKVTPEQRARNTKGVEGGDFGYDVYNARKAVEAQRGNAKSRELAKALNLKPGDVLGTLVFNDGKVTTGVKVNGLNESGLIVTFTGKRGAATLNGEVGVDRLAAAMDRAKERGKRKDGYAEFVAGRAALQQSQPAPATHADPGQAPEVATPAVVAQSVQKAARNEDTKPSEMRKWLVAEIDKALLNAPDRADYDEAVKRMGEKDAISMYTGNGLLGKNAETGFVTFDVPGDGKFKVRNSVRGLLEFRKNASASRGFKDNGQKPVKPEEVDGVRSGSGGRMAAIVNMIEEGDFEAARDYAEAVGISLDDVKVPKGDRKPEWEQFRKDGTLPPPPDTRPQPAPKTAAQLDEEKRQQQEAEAKKPKDTGWNMAGTGYAGKRYIGRNITTDDGREIVARVYENAGVYEEAEVKVDGVRKFTVTDRYNAQDKADAFIKTLMAGEKLDLKGFERIPKGNGYFDLRDGNMTVSVEPMGQGKYQASFRGAKSSPHLIGEQGAVDWAANYREESQRADAKTKDKAKPFTPPAGYKPAGEPFYRGGKLVQGYAPFAPGERVTMKDSAGQSGVVEGLIKPDDNGVFESAAVRFDNGTSQAVLLGKLEATTEKAALDATGPRRDPAKVSMFNPYEDGDIVTINGQDWTVKQDTPGWYLTTTGNWRGQHPTIRNVKAMADLIREVEQASVARKAAEIEPETPKLTQAEAKSLMEWQDLGQKDGVKTHALTFYESQADKDAKRGRMIVARVTKEVDGRNWMVEGTEEMLAVLGMAKKKAEQVGMARVVADGYVEQGATAPKTTAKPAATTTTGAPIEDAGEKIGGARKDRWKERGLNLDDLDAMTEAEGAELATKSNVWKPDYEALSAQSEPVTAAMVKTIYDQLAAKPKKNTPEGRRQYVQMMRIVRDVLTDAKGPEAVKNAYVEIRKRAGLNTDSPQAKSAARDLLFSVYKGRSDPFVLGYNEVTKAKKLVEGGFPAKGEPWKSRLTVGQREGGNGTTERGIELYLELSAEVGTPLTREQIEAGFFRVKDKKNKTVAFAPTKADAEAAAATVYERDMKGKKDGKPEPVRPNLDELKRENLPQRIDRDVTSEDFVRDLGFRGVEFGNWSAQDERQRIVNMAYDGLMDLAEIMGVPPKAMSLNGTLGMAFGARGGGRFAAHYEPGKLVINMTKIRGGGSMAHEWAHAMDHYFGELDKDDAYTTQARGASGWYSEDQYNGVPRKRMERVGNEWKNVEKMRLDNLRPEMAAAFDEVMRALFQKQITKAEMVRSHELDLERTQALARNEQDAELKAMYQNMVTNKRQALDELRKDPDDKMYAGRGRTDYANQAQALSGKSVDGYWVRPTEMFARAFESWVFDRVTAMGARSDYLVHGVEEDRFAGGGYKGNPYPTGEERARINAAFDKLASTIKTKETDKGVAMFSRAPAAFSFAGQQAATADQHALASAQQRLEAGEDAEAVRQDTGWHKGADGKWRFEISDQLAHLKGTGTFGEVVMRRRAALEQAGDRQPGDPVRLGDVMYHGSLFAAYPGLREIEVQFTPRGTTAKGRLAQDGANTTIQVREDLPGAEALSVLLHEIQHGIQAIEGFATGGPSGNWMWMGDMRPIAMREYQRLVQEISQPMSLQDYARQAWSSEEVTEEIRRDYEENFVPSHAKALERRGLDKDLQHTAGWNAYRRLAGEVEARNTQARQGMTDAQRRATPPNQTADVDDSDVIVVFNGKEMANAPMPANAAPDASATVQPLRTPAATIRAAITKAYGKLLGQLESKGLVTLTQTEDEAIEAAAQARAAKTGRSVERERARLHASIRGEADELSMSIYSDEAGKIERALEAMGLQVSTEGSRISQSTYVIVESPEYTQTEGESGSVLKIRVSDHRLPGGYQQPDFEVQVGNAHQGVDMADAAGAWFDAVRWVGRRFGVEPKGAAKRQIAAAAEKEAKAKQAAVAAADQQRNSLDTSKARLQAWLQSLPDGALWGNARRGGWVAVLDGKMIGRFDGETATGEGQPWYGGPYPVEAQKNLQPVRESLRASVKNSVADPDIRRSANGAIQGFFDPQTGQSFLIADNLTAEAAPGVLMHEVGIHMAADGSMKALFNRAAMMLKLQKGNPFIKAVQARMDAAGETSGEEAAAYIAEAYENDRANAPASVQRWLADLLAAVKAWMFKKGIMGADRLTVADIAAVARANARSMARGGGATGGQGFGTAFSRNIGDAMPHPFTGFTREKFLGKPKITPDSNAKDLIPSGGKSIDDKPAVPFSNKWYPNLVARYSENGAAVYDGEKVIASYYFGDTLVVDKKYRRAGIGSELVYQWRMRNPNSKTAATRTKKSQALQEKVWDRVQRELYQQEYGPAFSHAPAGDQTQTEAFKRWFKDSKVVDAEGKPLRVYHGTTAEIFAFQQNKAAEKDAGWYGRGIYFTADPDTASTYSRYEELQGKELSGAPRVMPVYVSIQNPYVWPANRRAATTPEEAAAIRKELEAQGHDGVIVPNEYADPRYAGHYEVVAFHPEQIKSAIGNNGNFDPSNPDIRFSRADMGSRAGMADDVAKRVGAAVKSVTVSNVKQRAGFKLTDYLGIGLQALGRRQIVDIYGDLLPLAEYNRLVQQMEADKNEGGAEADQLVTRWAKLSDETKLADLMHDATLAQIDPDKPYADGDDKAVYMMLQGRFKTLSDDAKAVYRATRDAYRAHHAKVRSAIKERIERSELKGPRKAELLKRMDDEFFAAVKGVYFPLARFGQYAVTVKGPEGKVESVSRAETKAEAEALRSNLLAAFPRDKGFTVGRVMLSKDFIADRDAVGRGFMTELYQVLDKQDIDAAQRAELEDTLGQLYLSSLPDLSWAKHGIHRKGTPGFSQDARRAFAQNMFHGARYLAKLRYSDLMQDELAAMQKHVDDWREVEDFDQNSAQRVVDEMNKRHESLMNPKSNPLSTALTSLGFVFHLGMSPASAMVNLSQTALVAYPIMGAKWGFNKASAALLKASKEAAAGKNDITGSLNADERAAYDEAVRAGTIDVTMAHDLAGIARGEDAGVMWKIRPVMRWASFLFHHAERFNRQVTFVAAYRLAREAGADNKAAFEQATKATYDGHFDYSASNRARIMQGNVAKVLLLFKQYGQNMVYTLSRNAYQSIKGTDAEKAEARKVLAGLLTSHAMAAGVLGLPMVTTLLAAASMMGGDDDEPWDAKVALQNMLADAFGQKPAEVLAHGLSRLTPWDISGRVGLDRLIFPDVQEGLEGQRLAESAMAAALGPVAGIGVNVLKGAQHMSEGRYAMGLEAMLPSALRGPVKALRYAEEGVQDKSGISILDQVSPAAVTGQALGFSPSAARNAQEGKSAILAHDRALGERRQELLTKIARATMAKDEEAKAEAREEIKRFNEKNPGRRINPNHIMASVHGRQKRINQAQDGVYLPRNRREAMEVGRFALAESE